MKVNGIILQPARLLKTDLSEMKVQVILESQTEVLVKVKGTWNRHGRSSLSIIIQLSNSTIKIIINQLVLLPVTKIRTAAAVHLFSAYITLILSIVNFTM